MVDAGCHLGSLSGLSSSRKLAFMALHGGHKRVKAEITRPLDELVQLHLHSVGQTNQWVSSESRGREIDSS